MTPKELTKRYVVFVGALFANALGIALLTDSGLGTSQVSSLPYVASFILPLSLGGMTMIVNAVFVAVQIPVLGKDFRPREFLQLPATAVFSVFIDLAMALCRGLAPAFYAGQLAMCAVGCVVLAFGVSLEIVCNVTVLPGEGIVRAIAQRTGVDFGIVKTIFDVTLVAAAVALSFACLGKLVGVREGTVMAALCIGTLTRFFRARLLVLHRWFTKA